MATLDENKAAVEKAVARLRALGREDIADAAIAAAEQHARYDDIGADPTLSTQGKQTGIARRYTGVMANLASTLTQAVASADRAYQSDTGSIFGTPRGLRGDPTQMMFLQRDADERVSRAQTPAERQQLLTAAVNRGDQTLSAAVARAAVANNDAATASAFQQLVPEHADAIERVWNVEQASNARVNPFSDNLWQRMHSLSPNTLNGRMGYEIDGLAATNAGRGRVTPMILRRRGVNHIVELSVQGTAMTGLSPRAATCAHAAAARSLEV